MSKTETDIEKHYIGGHGDLMSFVKNSTHFGSYDLSNNDVIGYLQSAAKIEDKDARELATSLIAKLQSVRGTGDELRKRFVTTHNALEKINSTLKSKVDANP